LSNNSSQNSIAVQKASGERETFSEKKLLASLGRSGASEELAQRVIRLVKQQARPGITSAKIYRLAFGLLHKEARHLAARYSLKQAIMALGPSGYPFERIIAALFAKQNYYTEVGVNLQGACVGHEVDVIATRPGHRLFVECKYRNNHGNKCDVKVALYVHARAMDLGKNADLEPFQEFWLATNAKFTRDAIQYGQCAGLKLLSWDYPERNGLRERIHLSQIHPLTCLTTLKVREKRDLLKRNIVLCTELAEKPHLLDSLRLKEAARRRVLREINDLQEI
jgi:Holliday junction resolvase-like predicted endonuclease